MLASGSLRLSTKRKRYRTSPRYPGTIWKYSKVTGRGSTGIRINDQYRICFAWADGDAHDVEIVDYH